MPRPAKPARQSEYAQLVVRLSCDAADPRLATVTANRDAGTNRA
jgi:hypothetical protein